MSHQEDLPAQPQASILQRPVGQDLWKREGRESELFVLFLLYSLFCYRLLPILCEFFGYAIGGAKFLMMAQ